MHDPLLHNHMLAKVRNEAGIIAALDQSGGNTERALQNYGVAVSDLVGADDHTSGQAAIETSREAAIETAMHQMRERIITSPAFNGTRIIGAILFIASLDRTIDGLATPAYLWEQKGVVPFVKVDEGLAEEADDAQLVKPMSDLDARLELAASHNVFGTKMRSLITGSNPAGIEAIVDQQFAVGHRALASGLVPIIEPEVDRNSPTKAEAEDLLHAALRERIDALGADQFIMLKLGLPTVANRYADLIAHPQVLRVAALSGGHERGEANMMLAANSGMIASFSRALVEDLRVDQDDATFTETLDRSIESIYQASLT